MKTSTISEGTRVMYSRRFLQSIGAYIGPAPFERGLVERLEPLGFTSLAVVRWDGGRRSSVLVANLVREDRLHLEPA